MELIADTSVIIAPLERVRRPEIVRHLNSIYGKILVPVAVSREAGEGNQRLVDDHIANGTIVITDIVAPKDIDAFRHGYRDMGIGESEVVLTWQRLKNMGIGAKCALDDRRARNVAKRLGVEFTGVLGLLEELELNGLLGRSEHVEVVSILKASDFRIP